MQLAFTDSIASAEEELLVEIAETPAQILEAKRVRYQVYCEERGFEAGQDGLEQDEFDEFSRHVLVRSQLTGKVFGTVRVAFSPPEQPGQGLPMERLCEPRVTRPLPRTSTAEVSRFALLRDRTGISPAGAALMRLCLIRGVIKICGDNGVSHLCALMERTLLRLLQATSIHFVPIGPAIEHRGLRHPTVWNVGEGLDRVCRENRVVWSFITANGAFWPEGTLVHATHRRLAR